jgi:murein DD-endopeptidase MepM/ murein hydrolase activator NlpD
MSYLRALRRSRALTLVDIARLTGIPARSIAAAEHGVHPLNRQDCERLALIFGLSDHTYLVRSVNAFHQRQAAATLALPASVRNAITVATLTSFIATGAAQTLLPSLATSPLLPQQVAQAGFSSGLEFTIGQDTAGFIPLQAMNTLERAVTVAAVDIAAPSVSAVNVALVEPGASSPEATLAAEEFLASVRMELAAKLSELGTSAAPAEAAEDIVVPPAEAAPPPETAAPQPTEVIAPPAFVLTEAGPQGCPLQPEHGRVVMTQGYGVGTHAPADVWGAVDLAVDGNGDGWAEPDATWDVLVVSTHGGVVWATPGSWPGGNHVWIEDQASGWSTGYAHLSQILVESGQYVAAGTVIGLVGNTGMATGPHLDYQVWHNRVNVDPTNLVSVCEV